MKTQTLAAMTAVALVLSAGAVAEQHDQNMVNVVIGTVVQVPLDQAAAACGTTTDEIRTNMAAMQAGGAGAIGGDTAATGAADGEGGTDAAVIEAPAGDATGGEIGEEGGNAAAGAEGDDAAATEAAGAGQTGGDAVAGAGGEEPTTGGEMTGAGSVTVTGLTDLAIVCIIGQDAAAEAGLAMENGAGQ